MKILDLRYISQGNNILILQNNEKFIIKYIVKKIDINNIFQIKNKKNILNNYGKNIEFQLPGLLFKISYLENNIIHIFTINKYDKPNNVLFLNIDLKNNSSCIEKINNYKKYKKYNILQLGIRIIEIFQPNNITKSCILLNSCLMYNRYNIIKNNFLKFNPDIHHKIENLHILLGFYTEYIKYNKYLINISVYDINETFQNKLKRLIKFKINFIYFLIKNNTFITYLYNIIIKDISFEPHKYMLGLYEYPKDAIYYLQEQLTKEVEYYKYNKNIYLEKYYKEIDNNIQISMKSFDNIENIKDNLLNNEIISIKIEDFKNYIKNGFNYIINNNNDIIKKWKIKNIDKWIIYLTKKYYKIEFIKNFLQDYNLYTELLVIVNTFYQYKNIDIQYDFTKNLNEIKNIIISVKI
jgi:hypothetical protein